MEQTIPFKQISDLRDHTAAFSQLGNDYIFSRINNRSQGILVPSKPIRVSGITFCLLLKGRLSIDVNGVGYEMSAGSLLAINSTLVVRIDDVDWDEIDAYVLFISQQFLPDINLNLNAINFSMIDEAPTPVVGGLTDGELSLLRGYMQLLDRNANIYVENIYSKNAARALIQALIYQLMQIRSDHASINRSKPGAGQSRQIAYVQEFLRLVQEHHFRERSIPFYAERMCVSPKYLSRIIKDSTGRSAASWIDHFVLQEAKNMLRYSDRTIQQVAYALNFSSQSSFGKFFKHLTGMSPSEYQKS